MSNNNNTFRKQLKTGLIKLMMILILLSCIHSTFALSSSTTNNNKMGRRNAISSLLIKTASMSSIALLGGINSPQIALSVEPSSLTSSPPSSKIASRLNADMLTIPPPSRVNELNGVGE